ncbi:nuclear transport factor 2 family protein [Roseiterribacter gracilis]|uniref:Nuclear transport factor 2 family protein n=1 Tax=Roseiterribacter gracilis TaxID=2812848 RepID=A0A8S8X8D4_9PROT|nr:hypothetical protein TMPK1_04190 [Rhodospirillales bacterium TMPK1]
MQISTMLRPLLLGLTLAGGPALAQTTPAPTPPPFEAKASDVATPEAIVTALYDVISGPVGQARDWDRFRSLFADGARLVPAGARPDGTSGYRVMTPEDYITRGAKSLVESGFTEREIHRVVESYGPVVHVFSTYEARHNGEKDPFARGINSIQLVNDGKRWYVLTIFWSAETDKQKVPAKYLPK